MTIDNNKRLSRRAAQDSLPNGLGTVLAQCLGAVAIEHPEAERHVGNQCLVPNTEGTGNSEDLLWRRIRGLPAPSRECVPNAERRHEKKPGERVNEEFIRIERRALSIRVSTDHLIDG